MGVLIMIAKGLNGGVTMCEICHSSFCSRRCPNASESKVKGRCEQCGEELREDYEYYTDNENNKFCSEDCAVEYHGIKIQDWDYE